MTLPGKSKRIRSPEPVREPRRVPAEPRPEPKRLPVPEPARREREKVPA